MKCILQSMFRPCGNMFEVDDTYIHLESPHMPIKDMVYVKYGGHILFWLNIVHHSINALKM